MTFAERTFEPVNSVGRSLITLRIRGACVERRVGSRCWKPANDMKAADVQRLVEHGLFRETTPVALVGAAEDHPFAGDVPLPTKLRSVAKCLRDAIASPKHKGRAEEIEGAARQLADLADEAAQELGA